MRRLHFKNLAATLGLAFALLWSTGCTSTRHIREAQDSWDAAARIENQLASEGRSLVGGQQDQAKAVADYRIALGLIERELQDNAGKLKAERLYGTAMMLKAQCLWRLADLDQLVQSSSQTKTTKELVESVKTSGVAKAESFPEQLAATLAVIDQNQDQMTLGDRDRIMLTALPGLRDHDRGLIASDLDSAARFFNSAISSLDEALAEEARLLAGTREGTELLRTYLRLAQLSSYRAWLSAITDFRTAAGDTAAAIGARDDVKQIKERAGAIITELEKVARDKKDIALTETLNRFKARLGV